MSQNAPRHDWRLLRFLARHCATGIVAGWALLLGLKWTDVGRIGTLMDNSDIGWLGYLMLAAGFGLTGGAVAMGVAVMNLGSQNDR
jgi:hypothetical protein